MKNARVVVASFVSAVLLASAQQVVAEEVPSGVAVEQNAQRLDGLEQKLHLLESRLDAGKEAVAPKASSNELLLRSADGINQLKFNGYIQAVDRTFLDEGAATDSFIIRRLVTTFDAKLLKNIDFRTQWDFGLGKVATNDTYLNVRLADAVQLRAGKFKVPFGLENLVSSADLLFIERALPTALGPNRDIGFQLHGDQLGKKLNYAVGVFNGVADGATGDGDTGKEKEFAGRVFALPFTGSSIKPLEGLGIGIAGTYGKQDSGTAKAPNLAYYKTPGQENLFSYTANATPTTANTVVASGNHYRISPQGYYYFGPAGLLGEYVISTQNVSINNKSAKLRNDAWQVQLSYVLTGENATHKGVTPARPFIPGSSNSGWGAVQIVARYNALNIDNDTFPTYARITSAPRSIKAVAGGVNWYLNDNLKVVLNYEQSTFDGGAAAGDRVAEKVFASNVQVAF